MRPSSRLLKYPARMRGASLGLFDFPPTLSHRELLALFETDFIVLSPFPRIFHPSRCLQTDFSQRAHAREVVGGHRQHKNLIHALESSHHDLADASHRLGPAKALLDGFSLLHRD